MTIVLTCDRMIHQRSGMVAHSNSLASLYSGFVVTARTQAQDMPSPFAISQQRGVAHSIPAHRPRTAAWTMRLSLPGHHQLAGLMGHGPAAADRQDAAPATAAHDTAVALALRMTAPVELDTPVPTWFSPTMTSCPASPAIAQLDLLFRGAAIGLLMLAAVVFARAPASLPSRFGLALTLCTVVGTLAGLPHAPTALDPLLDLSSSAAIPLFWLFARAWFDDAFRPKPIDLVLAAAFLLGTLYASLQGRGLAAPIQGLDIAIYAAGTGFAIHAQWLAWHNRSGDLVEARRQARTIFVVSIGLVILWLLGSEIVGRATGALAVSGMASAAGLFMGAFVITALLFGLRHPEVFPRAIVGAVGGPVGGPGDGPVDGEVPVIAVAPDPLDASLERALTTMMIDDRAYRDPTLTIGMIAARVEIPEYRVRRHINGGLGYRNVSDYLNEHRIGEVRSALADPAQADVPILTIAMDAGFGSLVMFNRVFKDRLGETPSAFRRRHLEG